MRFWSALLLVCSIAAGASGQEALEKMPRYDRYTRLQREISSSVINGGVSVTWSEDSKSFFYSFNGKNYKYDVDQRKSEITTETAPSSPEAKRRTPRRGGMPDRGRQFSSAESPDGKFKAVSRDRNVYVSDADGKSEFAVTTDGNLEKRIKYGTACWVYGEELEVRDAMWWSPDSRMLAFYRFDESQVKDYFIAMDEGKVQDRLDTEAYPKAGAPNPRAGLLIYDLDSKKTIKIDTTFGDASLGEYVYDVRWSQDGTRLYFNRTDRKQKTMQFCEASPSDGSCRVVVEEKQPQSWAENHPEVRFLRDGRHFIWASERDGFINYYLYDREDGLVNQLTHNDFDALSIARIDEDGGGLFYMACGTENPYYRQLRRVGLDGTGDMSVTDRDLDHEVTLSPDGSLFTDIAQTPDRPAETRLVDIHGKVLDTFVKSDLTKFESLKLKKAEMFDCLAADGKTRIYGILHFPSDFDHRKKYPLLLTVYGGPESGGINSRFQTPNPITELGFVVVNVAGRGTMGRGKAFRDAVYQKLGVVEIDDQNAAIRSLGARHYVDLKRVGVFGTSYGGYATVMLMLRHPETFSVGCASSSVTDWLNYDSIYTERYMGLPQDGENKAGYDAGSAMKYVSDLRGKLMLYFGSADNNVHPSNTYQLIRALEDAGKRYDLQAGTDRGHTQMNPVRMWEYFVTHLIIHPHSDPMKTAWNQRRYRRARSLTSKRNS
jgi:dipeptidyl-peptidase-4